MNVIYSLFTDFLDDTLAASLVILVVFTLLRLLHKVISVRIRYLLWLLVIIRLLLPVIPDSPLSMFHVVQYGEQLKSALTGFAANQESASDLESGGGAGYGVLGSAQHSDTFGDRARPGNTQPADLHAAEAELSDTAGSYSPWMKAAAVIWFTGAILFLLNALRFITRQSRWRKQLNLVTDQETLRVLEKARQLFGVTRNIPIYTGSSARSPFLSGVFRPWIYLPESALQDLMPSQLLHILAHELAHYKRRDTLWNLLGTAALAIHWLNPLLWLGLHQMKADRELACDAYVLDVLGEEEAAAYGLTLVDFLKRFSRGETSREVLYFFGSQQRPQMIRRVSMIQSFKKGSYRISAAAVLLLVLLSVVTLTNASGDSKQDGNPPTPATQKNSDAVATAAVNDDLIESDPYRNYNRLDRAVEEAGFAFQVPSILPAQFTFDRVQLSASQSSASSTPVVDRETDEVWVDFTSYDGGSTNGQLWLHAYNDSSVDEVYTNIEQFSRGDGDSLLPIDRHFTTLGGVNVQEITVHVNPYVERVYYLWERDGIVYKLDLNALLSRQEVASLLASMQYPDEQMLKRFVSKKFFTVSVVDMKDLRLAVDAMGFVPKFSTTEAGFNVHMAMITTSTEFSHPRNAQDKSKPVFWMGYSNPDAEESEITKSFTFIQMQDQGLYENLKADNQIFFSRIDGEKFAVPLTLTHVNGQEVLVTEPYKIDGELSSPNETDFLSYFWLEDGVIYKVGFTGVPALERQQEIVASFIKAPAADLEQLAASVSSTP